RDNQTGGRRCGDRTGAVARFPTYFWQAFVGKGRYFPSSITQRRFWLPSSARELCLFLLHDAPGLAPSAPSTATPDSKAWLSFSPPAPCDFLRPAASSETAS